MKWIRKLFLMIENLFGKILHMNTTTTVYLNLNGVDAPKKIQPTELASARIAPAYGGFSVLEITLKDGATFFLVPTDENLGEIAMYVEILMVARNENGQYILVESEQSKLKSDVRKENKIKFKF
jgi:hypothetical protein